MNVARSEFEIMEILPLLEGIHVERDHDTGRESDLDDPKVRELWRRLVLTHGASGLVEISTMHIDGDVAAFVIGIIDDDAYRVFDGHFNSEFARHSPGRILESAVLERAMVDARFDHLDWMAGVAAEKILTSNHSEGRLQLVASAKTTESPAPKPVPAGRVASPAATGTGSSATQAGEKQTAAKRAANGRRGANQLLENA